MIAPFKDATNDAVQFLTKHGDLTRAAAYDAIRLLTGNGFVVTQTDMLPSATDLSQAAVAAALEAAARVMGERQALISREQVADLIRAQITQPQHDAMQAAIDAARKVKPLDWSDAEYPNECWNAGDYDIWSEHGGFQVYHWSIKTGDLHHDLKAAQDAAFTHHETRVQSFLAQIGAKP